MKIQVSQSKLSGIINVPASKSHTIRSFIFATLAKGKSIINRPLLSKDTLSCIDGCQSLGASVNVNETSQQVIIEGVGKKLKPVSKMINVGNSGTTLRLLAGAASLSNTLISFDGDQSIRQRPMKSLLQSLIDLGISASSRNNEGMCPITIKGPLKGGSTTVSGITSQYLSSLLMVTPLALHDSLIQVHDLHEKPYIKITLSWLDKLGIEYEESNFELFKVKGNQKYNPFVIDIPADFSTACFPLCAALITKSKIVLEGLDFSDAQGDKILFDIAEKMGAKIEYLDKQTIIDGSVNNLKGLEIDLNSAPDALPVLSVLACFIEGKTVIKNVSQARIKECDRIFAMVTELRKMGANIDELNDGMIIYPSKLKSASLKGYHDHRVVMALTLAGMATDGVTEIDSAESVSITYPDFVKDMISLGSTIKIV